MSRIPYPLLTLSIGCAALLSQACSAFNPLIDQRVHQICSTSQSVSAERVQYRRERIYQGCTQIIGRQFKLSDLYRAKLKRLQEDPALVAKYQVFLAKEAQKVEQARDKIRHVSNKSNACTTEELRWMSGSDPNGYECRLRRRIEREDAERDLDRKQAQFRDLTNDGFEAWLDENGYLKKLPMQDYIE